jgi:class 3 adenylate cyclase
VYVEYGEAAQTVGSVHEEALVALCAQAAAPLWSVELEERLLEADEHQQSLMEVHARPVPTELLRILDVDDVPRIRRGERVEREMTVLLAEIRGRTALIEGTSAFEASELSAGAVRAVEVPVASSNGLLQDIRGNEALALFDTAPDDAVLAGLAVVRSLREHSRERVAHGFVELRVGIGVGTGSVALGLAGGVNRVAFDVVGDAVNLASRVARTTKRYGSGLLIDGETYGKLAGADRFDIRRMERLPVVSRSRPVTVYEVYDEDPEALRAAKRDAQPTFDDAFAWFDTGHVKRARAAFERCRALLPDDPIAPRHLAYCDALERGEAVPGQNPSPR